MTLRCHTEDAESDALCIMTSGGLQGTLEYVIGLASMLLSAC